MKCLVVIIAFLALWCVYQNLCINSLVEENTALEAEKKALIINNERLVKNEMELRKQKSDIKKAVEAERLNFDWGYNLSNSPVRKRLSDNCKSCTHRAD